MGPHTSTVPSKIPVKTWATLTNSGLLTVVTQSFEAEADNEYVIRGNAAIMKCEVPSFVADFVNVEMWTDSEGNSFLPGTDYGNLRGRRFLDTLLSAAGVSFKTLLLPLIGVLSYVHYDFNSSLAFLRRRVLVGQPNSSSSGGQRSTFSVFMFQVFLSSCLFRIIRMLFLFLLQLSINSIKVESLTNSFFGVIQASLNAWCQASWSISSTSLNGSLTTECLTSKNLKGSNMVRDRSY